MSSSLQADPITAPPQQAHVHDAGPSGSHASPFSRLVRLLRAEKRDLWVAVAYSAAIGILTLALPLATQSLVNTIAFGSLLQPVAVLTILLLAFLAFSALLQTFRTWTVEMIQRRVFVRVCSESFQRLAGARVEAFDRQYAPELVNRFLDVVTVQKASAMLLIDGLSVLMQTLIGMALLAAYHPLLALLDTVLVVGIVVVLFVLGMGAVPTAVSESRAKYALVAWLEEIARFPVTFKSSPGRLFARERTDLLVRDYLSSRSRHFRILLRQIVGSLLLQAVASSLLLGVGGYLVINRELTLGQLIAAELVLALVVSGFTKFGKHLEVFYDMLAALDKLGYLTDLPVEASGRERLRPSSGGAALSLRNVSFRYGARQVIRNADWHVPSGARVGLYAHSGQGKSTLTDLLYGLRMPDAGQVEIDNLDYRDVNLDELRSAIAVVRSPEIFEGTVADNLRMARTEIESGAMRHALAAVGLLDDVLALPEGLNTKLSTGGLPLSHGQALRLALARAILIEPRLLIIDDCLDHLDADGERDLVVRCVLDRRRSWTVVLASESRDVIANCDRRYALRDGRIEELD